MGTESQTLSPEQLLSHLDWLRHLARALVRDEADADDLAQETAAVALDSTIDTGRPIRPWLAGVARNLARMRARAAGRRRRREQEAASPDAIEADAERLVERVETQRLVSELVLELDEPFRTAVLLRFVEGLTAADIATRLGIPAGTVRWRIKRALDTLREQLDARHGGERASWHAALLPMTTASSTASQVAKGVLLVKTGTKIAIALAVLLAAVITGHFAGWFSGDAQRRAQPAASGDDGKAPGQGAGLSPVATSVAPNPGGMGVVAMRAPDPRGTLRLEGQVIDERDRPVAGATVAVDSSPPRSARTEDDGSFAIVGLIGRRYAVEARSGELYAGPVDVPLSAKTEPLILRAKAGASLRVKVHSAGDNSPVAGARVELRSTLMWTSRTDDAGIAVLRGVGTSWRTLVVSAKGYASSSHMITRATSAAEQTISVRLEAGAKVVGSVRTESGSPVSGARVWASSVTEPFPVVDPRIDAVVSNADGEFELAALPAGSYRFTAAHPSIAETATAPVNLVLGGSATEVDIVAEAGGVLEAEVRDADGNPVAGADVIVSARAAFGWAYSRAAASDDSGVVRLEGLPRRPVDAVARTGSAASDVVVVDLSKSATGKADLRLTISGRIRGVVVDSGGDPVAEAQVVAEPVWSGDVGERAGWRSQGVGVQVVGTDGAYSIAGLAAGSYRLRASRTGADPGLLELHPGVVAKPGDTGVAIALPAETAVTGKVLLSDGSAPEAFVVSIGESLETPFSSRDGAFSLPAVAGTYNLIVSGPGILTKLVPDVELSDQEVTDVGTISVDKGRSVSGRVVDDDGRAVAGATVVAGGMLTGDGKQLYVESESPGSQQTVADAQGRFVLSGFDDGPLVLVAGHEERGRSLSVSIPRSSASVEVDLVLVETGALVGTVTRDDKPLSDTVVIANPRGATRSSFFVITGPDGSFAFDALSSGEYSVMAVIGGGGGKPKDMHTREVALEAGQRTPVSIDIDTGSIAIEIALGTDDGKPVPMAQVVVGTGTMPEVDSTMETLRQSYESQMAGTLYLRTAMGGKASLSGLAPGTYSACVVPIPADPSDPAQMQRVMSRLETMPARCLPLGDLQTSPDAPVTITVPAKWMQPPS